MLKIRNLIFSVFAIFFFGFLFQIEILKPDPFSEAFIAHDVKEEYLNSDFMGFESIFSQPFQFLGRGQQSVAFLSSDKKYVLKFFLKKAPRFRTKIVFLYCKNKKKREFRIQLSRALKSYEWAFRDLKGETALIGIHLKAGGISLPLCTVRDWTGRAHSVDLNRASFVLQHYCDVLDEKNIQMKQRDVYPLLRTFFQERTAKGYTDFKRRFNPENFAFQNGKAVMIDPGNLEYVEALKACPEAEVDRIMKLVCSRLEELSQ